MRPTITRSPARTATAGRTTAARRGTTPTTGATAPAAAISSFLVRHCRWELMAQPKRPLPRQ